MGEVQEEESKESIKRRSLIRSKIRLRRLINANIEEWDKFITLTFADNITDVSYANDEFRKFKQRLKYRMDKKLKYVTVIQYQKRGAIHYHILLNCDYIPHKKLESIWGHGYVKINQIDNVDNVGAYVVSYMDDDFSKINENKKRYFHSRNLKKPIVIKNDSKVAELFTEFKNIKPDFEKEYDTEYFGKVNYQQYKC